MNVTKLIIPFMNSSYTQYVNSLHPSMYITLCKSSGDFYTAPIILELSATPMPAPTPSSAKTNTVRNDMAVILVTGSYDHEIRFWEAWSGICSRTISRTGEPGVSFVLLASLCLV